MSWTVGSAGLEAYGVASEEGGSVRGHTPLIGQKPPARARARRQRCWGPVPTGTIVDGRKGATNRRVVQRAEPARTALRLRVDPDPRPGLWDVDEPHVHETVDRLCPETRVPDGNLPDKELHRRLTGAAQGYATAIASHSTERYCRRHLILKRKNIKLSKTGIRSRAWGESMPLNVRFVDTYK